METTARMRYSMDTAHGEKRLENVYSLPPEERQAPNSEYRKGCT